MGEVADVVVVMTVVSDVVGSLEVVVDEDTKVVIAKDRGYPLELLIGLPLLNVFVADEIGLSWVHMTQMFDVGELCSSW